MKKIFSLVCVLAMLLSISVVPAAASGNEDAAIRVPEKITWFDSTEALQDAVNERGNDDSQIMPMVLIGYEYCEDKSAKLGSMTKDLYYAEITTRAVTLPEGAKVHYVRGITAEKTETTAWDVDSTVSFPIKVVEIEINGQYQEQKTAKITATESWEITYETPGQYIATWYMIGNKYNVTGNCKIISTDGNDGTIVKNHIMGYFTVPTDGIHIAIVKA